ncbi:AAA family ATPase [Nocardia acidivorans]|uniref:AAA family ATPase n=1 Tax=Nocardia acidivorans TaxID=404580 RepID=UPI000A46F33C|nr:AAA family ATPase [Nocardia acidivorans]
MNPPLDTAAAADFDPEYPRPRMLAPHRVHDLRGRTLRELRYPASAAVIFTGVPGAGKSTALRKLFGDYPDSHLPARSPSGAVLVDSQQSRKWWQHRVSAVPYPLLLPIVHLTHYRRIRAALRRADGPVVIHDCGTRHWVRRLVTAWARANGRPIHLIMIDAPAELARAGQISRGRTVGRLSFQWHCMRWQHLVDRAGAGVMPEPAPDSVVILDRPAVTALEEVTFSTPVMEAGIRG